MVCLDFDLKMATSMPYRALKVVNPGEMPISTLVGFFMVRPAFPSAIERRTAFRSMWWYDPTVRL
jgi:hypothetical protein